MSWFHTAAAMSNAAKNVATQVKKYYEQMYANKWGYLGKMETRKQKLLVPNDEEVEDPAVDL